MKKKFIIDVSTNWCGEENSYAAYAESIYELDSIGACLAYDNFAEFEGFEAVKAELFPEIEENYTDEQEIEAAEVEADYYSYTIREVETEDEISEFAYLDLVYDREHIV